MDRDELAALDAAVLTLRHSVVTFGGVAQPTIRDKIADGIRALIDENARLREALEGIVGFIDYSAEAQRPDVFWMRVDAARAALSPNPD